MMVKRHRWPVCQLSVCSALEHTEKYNGSDKAQKQYAVRCRCFMITRKGAPKIRKLDKQESGEWANQTIPKENGEHRDRLANCLQVPPSSFH